MKKPIYRAFVFYEIKKKNATTVRKKCGTLDTFILTSNIEEVKNEVKEEKKKLKKGTYEE